MKLWCSALTVQPTLIKQAPFHFSLCHCERGSLPYRFNLSLLLMISEQPHYTTRLARKTLFIKTNDFWSAQNPTEYARVACKWHQITKAKSPDRAVALPHHLHLPGPQVCEVRAQAESKTHASRNPAYQLANKFLHLQFAELVATEWWCPEILLIHMTNTYPKHSWVIPMDSPHTHTACRRRLFPTMIC